MNPVLRLVRRLTAPLTREARPSRRDDGDDGVGVAVPAGPKPRKDGAAAKPPSARPER